MAKTVHIESIPIPHLKDVHIVMATSSIELSHLSEAASLRDFLNN